MLVSTTWSILVSAEGVFYERSAGLLTSGNDAPDFDGWAPTDRPSALYLSTNIGDAGGVPDAMADRGGYVWLDYGQSGNVMGMTVHGQCHDVDASHVCEDVDPESTSAADRKVAFEAGCLCAQEQHYRYDWDELNRLAEARRYDRTGGTGAWTLAVQQRYQYDAGNVRMIKQTIDHSGSPFAAVTLTPYPGNFERRGLELNTLSETYDSSPTLGSESQYNVGGARLVWRTDDTVTGDLTRQQRLTLPLSDLLQSTAAVVDLQSGDLIEHTTFYPNGARETHLATDEVSLQLEPNGFTGKEADEEVGLVYFGERYLIPRLGRWASVDPLSVHAMGGGEVMNGYHYVAGNVLQARDPIGLQGGSSLFVGDMNAVPTPATETASVETSVPNVALTIQTNMVLDRPGARTGVSRNSYVGVTVSLMGVSDQSTRFIQFIRTTSYREATDRVGGRTGPLQTPAVQRQRTNIGDEILHNGQGQWMVDSTSRNGRYDGVVSRGDTQYTMWDAPGTGTSRSTGGAVVPSDILSTLLTEPVRIIETVQEVETYAFVNGEVVACATWEVRTTYRLVGGRNVRPENANVQITQEHTLVGVQSASSLPDDRQAQLNAYTANPRSQFRVNDSTPSGGNSGSGGQAAPSTSSGGSSP